MVQIAMQCFFYNSKELVNESHVLWDYPIPSSPFSTAVEIPSVSYGNYFSTVFSTIKRDNFKILLNIITQRTGQLVTLASVKYISIFLEKHGSFYHPSKLEVCLGNSSLFFVINVAISKEGKTLIKEEVKALNLLYAIVPFGFLPQVYAYTANNSVQLPMFFGEWFAEFHEFHLSINQKTGKNGILVWNYSPNKYFLSEEQTRQLYYQIAMIISSYYDLKSTNRIFYWHNASGDFIIKISENFVQTRLVSVRSFKPMLVNNNVKNAQLSWDNILHSLTIFLLHISIQIRLDRLDGVGNLTLTSCNYIEYIVKGFFQGIYLTLINKKYPTNFIVFLKNYLLSYSKNDLSELTFDVINKVYNKREDELSVIISKLDEHIESLYLSLKRLC